MSHSPPSNDPPSPAAPGPSPGPDPAGSYHTLGDLFRVRREVSVTRKALYIATVFVGLNLSWYGVWTAIGDIWPLKLPPVAIALGAFILWATGKTKALL